MGQLENKTALVTGASAGIGLAAACRFAAEGAHVFITGRRKPELDAAAAEIGSGATAVQGDVANLDDLNVTLKRMERFWIDQVRFRL